MRTARWFSARITSSSARRTTSRFVSPPRIERARRNRLSSMSSVVRISMRIRTRAASSSLSARRQYRNESALRASASPSAAQSPVHAPPRTTPPRFHLRSHPPRDVGLEPRGDRLTKPFAGLVSRARVGLLDSRAPRPLRRPGISQLRDRRPRATAPDARGGGSRRPRRCART